MASQDKPSQSTTEKPANGEDHWTDPTIELTPLRAHYLKKSLIQLQFHHELDALTTSLPSNSNVSPVAYLGAPFAPPLRDAPPLDLPFLRYIFRQYVLTFPFMAAAPKDFYSLKLQPFITSILSRNLSPVSALDDGAASEEEHTRQKLLAKFERNLSLFLGSATKLVEKEEVVRLSQKDLDRLKHLKEKRAARVAKRNEHFEVNVIGIRHVSDKGKVRTRTHEEFIIRTRRSHHPDIFVSRRYGDFRTLADELRRAHPGEAIRPPPTKDRTASSGPSFSLIRTQTMESSFSDEVPMSPASSKMGKLSREKNRLTLRAYLHSLMTSSSIASSPVLRSFLTASPTILSPEEVEDAKRREEADQIREDGRKRFAHEIAARVDGLRAAVKSVKGDVMGPDGLTRVFATIKTTPDIRALPNNYLAVLEWARISLAATVFHSLVAADDSSETFASLKRIHGLMPYFMMKTALKISNPIGMIRTILDLFLAQPFGGRSLLQRMFTSSMTEEVKDLETDIEAVAEKIDDPVMCEKIHQFVYAPREIQKLFKEDAARENVNILSMIMRSGDEPALSRAQMQRVVKSHRAWSAYIKAKEANGDSDDDDGPQDEDAWLFEDFKVLAALYSRLRDREQLIELIFEGSTAELLKDIITIFYSPLAQVYKAASIADSLGDMQNFIIDLIKTVEQVEELSSEDPSKTVQAFIDLIQRHEQSFYSFVHKVHSKGENLFDSLMRWIELFLTLVRDGLGAPISLEFLLPHTGQDRVDILAEVDAVALYHYKLKVQHEDKLRRRFVKAQAVPINEADAEDEATQNMVEGVMGELSFGDLVQGDADDLAAVDSDESDTSSEYETDSDDSDVSAASSAGMRRTTSAQPKGSPSKDRFQSTTDVVDSNGKMRKRSLSMKGLRSMPSLKHLHITSRSIDAPPVPKLPNGISPSPLSPRTPRTPPRTPPSGKLKARKPQDTIPPPDLKVLPHLMPMFVEMMRPLLRPRQTT